MDQLTTANPDELLAAFVTRFNDLTESYDEQATFITLLQQQLDGYKRQCATQHDEIAELTRQNEFCKEMALKAEDIANKSIGLQRERDSFKTQLTQLQQQYSQLKAENPKRLKEQIKRVKEANTKAQSRVASLEKDVKHYRDEANKKGEETQRAITKIIMLEKQLSHDTGSGLYHNGDHHLIIWPQKTTMQRPDGSRFEGRSLLYLHNSGRGGLLTYDPENGTSLCAAPKGGLRPSTETLDFAQNWLFKVNETQAGIVHDDDMRAVNYNGNFDSKAA
jgi:seryl-tRNA synthetase